MFALLLIPAALWPTTYFWVQTAAGQAQLTSAVADRFADGLLEVQGIGWGPAPGSLWLRGVVIRDVQDQPAITAEAATLEVDVTDTWTTGLTVERAVVRGFGVHLAWARGGGFNLSRPWLPPRKKPIEPRAPRPPPLVSIDGIDLQEGVVTLTWPTWALRFEGVQSDGQVTAGGDDGLVIAADLHGGTARATLRGRPLRFEQHRIDGFQWRDGGFRTEGVTLTGPGDSRVVASGTMDFSVGLAMDAEGSVSLPAVDEGGLLAPWVSEGVAIDHLSMTRTDHGPWSVDVSSATVPTLRVGPVNVTGLKTSFKGAFGSGALLPHVAVQTREMSAQGVEVADLVRAQSLTVGGLDVDVGPAIAANLDAIQLSTLSMAGQAVADMDLTGTVAANVGGGAVDLTLKSADGALSVSGPVETSLLRQRMDVTLEVSLDEVRAGLAAWVRPQLPEAERPPEATPLNGSAVGHLRLAPSGRPRWSWKSFRWAEGVP